MNLFKNLLFLHGHFVDPHMDDAADGAAAAGRYGQGYGNRAAAAKALRESWESFESARAAVNAQQGGSGRACHDAG